VNTRSSSTGGTPEIPQSRADGFQLHGLARDNDTPKVHPTQKPLALMERLIEIFTDEDDVVIDRAPGVR
jgi:site-specific DNA-methyltransferase (adenine-specific)